VDPKQALPSGLRQTGPNRWGDARVVYQTAKIRSVQAGHPTRARYFLAFLEGDRGTMTQMADLLEQQHGFEGEAGVLQSATKLFSGRCVPHAKGLTSPSTPRHTE
jgi:hypothetical protein